MFTNTGISKAGLIIAGVTLGWATGANAQTSALDTSQTPVATAQQHADAARQRATDLAKAGGWAYKTGQVERAQREAVRYQEEAERAVAEAQSCAAPATPTPEQSAALARLEELRQAGGWAYKTGAVARAEREVQALAAQEPAQTPVCGRQEDQPRVLMTSKL